MINIHIGNARSKTIIVIRTKYEQMSLKFGKIIRKPRLSQNYLVLIKKGVLVKGETEMKLSIVVILK